MRLAELEPRWLTILGRDGMGVSFRCPCQPRCPSRVFVEFGNPLDGGRPDPYTSVARLWRRQGKGFDELTLEPGVRVAGHWQGLVRHGEVITT